MNSLATTPAELGKFEKVLIQGDLSVLSETDRIQYYARVCESVGLNPLTKPFEYIKLNGKLVLYALKGATDQLRQVYSISISRPEIQFSEGLVIVSVTARSHLNGREDSDVGVVPLGQLQGEAKANAIMKAITKAKRRVTLSICGLGMLDETEIESIPQAAERVHTITLYQQKRLWAIAKESGHNEETMRALVEKFGFDSFKAITTDVYDKLCAAAADTELLQTLTEAEEEF
jgi:hypothetical protein